MPEPADVIMFGVIPFLIALVALTDAHRVFRPGGLDAIESTASGGVRGPWMLAPLLLAVLTPLGMQALHTRFQIWPDAVTERSPALGLIAGGAGLLVASLPFMRMKPVILAIAAIAGAAAVWIFLSELPEQFLSNGAKAFVIGGLGVYAGVQAVVLERAAVRVGRLGGLLLWVFIGLATLGGMMGYASGTYFTGPVVALCFAAGLVAFVRPETLVTTGLATAIAVFFTGFVAFVNWFGDEENWLMLGTLLAAGLAPGLVFLAPREERPLLRIGLAFVPMIILAGTPASIAVPALIQSQSGDAYEYDY